MSYPTLAPFVLKRAWLTKLAMPFAKWYANAAGYRQLGLRPPFRHQLDGQIANRTGKNRADDLIPEESDTVQLALKRLPPTTNYDRIFRIRRAQQLSLSHKLLPRAEWTKPEDDKPYLIDLIREIDAEKAEKDALDSLTVVKQH